MRIIIELNKNEKERLKSVKNNIQGIIEEVEKVINAFKKAIPKVVVK